MNEDQAGPSDERLKQLSLREKSLFVWTCIWAGLSTVAWIVGWADELFTGNPVSSHRRIIWFPSWLGPTAEWVVIFAAGVVITFLEWLDTVRRRKKEQHSQCSKDLNG